MIHGTKMTLKGHWGCSKIFYFSEPLTSSEAFSRFKGSDDYLRTKFEEYIAAALSTVKLRAYKMKDSHSILAPGISPEIPYLDQRR
jgi:hypothetical protein